MSTEERKKFTRREVMKLGAKGLAGAAMLTVVPGALVGCGGNDQAAELPSKEVLEYEYKEKSEDDWTGPYPYQKLDVATTQERGHAGFYNLGNCCIGAADATIGQLADEAGYPFNQVPLGGFKMGGGGFGVGTMCGAVAGALAAIGLVCEPEDAAELKKELFDWYKNTPLPQYQPDTEIEQVVAGSVNCDESVTKYMDVSNTKMSDPLRMERCACVTADCAGKAAELLNEHFGL